MSIPAGPREPHLFGGLATRSGLVEETVRTGRKSRRRRIARAAGSLALQLKCVVKHLNTLLHALRSEV